MLLYSNKYKSYYNKLSLKTLYKHLEQCKKDMKQWKEICEEFQIPHQFSKHMKKIERAYVWIEDSIIQKERAQGE